MKPELEADRGESVRFGRHVWLRTLYGMALTFVLSTQLLEFQTRDGTIAGGLTALRSP